MTGAEVEAAVERVTRPIIGIENRTAQEVFDIMSDRIRHAARSEGPHPDQYAEVGKMIQSPGESGGEWVMVPREPTEAQVQAACDATFQADPIAPEEAHRRGYAAMIAASPPPPKGAGTPEDGSSRSQPVLSPKSDNAGEWVEWIPGLVEPQRHLVERVRLRSGWEYDPRNGGGGGLIWDWSGHVDTADEIIAYRLSDGALGRQDEVVQPIRDEPISSSKGEALPVVDRVLADLDGIIKGVRSGSYSVGDIDSLLCRTIREAEAFKAAARPSPGVSREEVAQTLKPFAEVSAKAKGSDDACWCGQDGAVIRYRDLRRAAALYEAVAGRAALSSQGEGE